MFKKFTLSGVRQNLWSHRTGWRGECGEECDGEYGAERGEECSYRTVIS